MTAPTFASLLTAFRQERGLTQHQLAALAGFDGAYISRLEAGKREPSRETVEVLADALEAKYWQRTALIVAAGYLPDTNGIMSLTLDMLSDLRRNHQQKCMRYVAYIAYEALHLVYLDTLNGQEVTDVQT